MVDKIAENSTNILLQVEPQCDIIISERRTSAILNIIKGVISMLDQKIFGERLRGHRVRLNLTQEEVAGRLGVSPQAVSKWERDDSHI